MEKNQPTIKGLFVKTHVRAIKKKRGPLGLRTLQAQFGKPLKFGAWQNIPVADEVKLINCAVVLYSDQRINPEKLDYEAGRFHCQNFLTTPLAKTVMKRLGKNFKLMMLLASKVAGQVFRGLKAEAEDLGENKVKIVFTNSGYPVEHFAGFFEEWMSYLGLLGIARGEELEPGNIKYIMTWKEKETQ